MNRLNRYKESLNRFIKEKSCLLDEESISNTKLDSILYNRIKKSDYILSILFLTIMNSQNKKNNINSQGYYIAATIEFIKLLIDIIDNNKEFIKLYNIEIYNKIINYLIFCCNKSMLQNLESIKDVMIADKVNNNIIDIINLFNEHFQYKNIIMDVTFEFDNSNINSDLVKWYIKYENEAIINNLNTMKKIKRESFNNYLNNKLGSLCDIVLCLGWLIGFGSKKKIPRIKKLAKYFTLLYKLTKDFEYLDDDIDNKEEFSKNYVINYGLQESYELFMYNKQKFIEECMLLDIYTNTIKEIIYYFEKKVDIIIDKTSPELKSNYSNN